jgi:hypothetical protein
VAVDHRPGRALLDALTEAALEVDQARMADWWAEHARNTVLVQFAEEAFRRGYRAAWVAVMEPLTRTFEP